MAILSHFAADVSTAADLNLRFDDGRPPMTLPLERVEEASDELFVAANALAPALHLERYWKPETRKLVLKLGERKIQVTVDTRLVLVDDQDLLLRVPVRYRQGSVMLPLEFLEHVLVPAMGGGLQLDRASLTLQMGASAGYDVTGVDYDVGSEATRVRVHLAKAFRYRAEATSQSIVRLTLFDARVDAVSLTADHPTPLVRTLRAEQRANQAVLYVETAQGTSGFAAAQQDGGRTVVLTLPRAREAAPAPEFKLPHVARTPRASSRPDSFDVLVLDPGHGGYDHGVQGPGHDEKDVTLALALQLVPILERDLGVKVVLVRDADRAVTPERRAEIANRSHGDVLLSLHCNGWYDAKTGGFEVLSAAPQQSAGASGAAGDAGSPGATGAATAAVAADLPSDFVPWDTVQQPFVEKSRMLAQYLQVELGRRLSIENRGAKQADVELLKGAAMPAALLEVGFLTNPAEAATITGEAFANDLAAAVVAAMRRMRGLPAQSTADSLRTP